MNKIVKLKPGDSLKIEIPMNGNTIIFNEENKFKDGDFVLSEFEDCNCCISILKGEYNGENENLNTYIYCFCGKWYINSSIGTKSKRTDSLANSQQIEEFKIIMKKSGYIFDTEDKIIHFKTYLKTGDIVKDSTGFQIVGNVCEDFLTTFDSKGKLYTHNAFYFSSIYENQKSKFLSELALNGLKFDIVHGSIKEIQSINYQRLEDKNESYFYIDSYMSIVNVNTNYNNTHKENIDRKKVGNYFETIEEAQFKLDLMKDILNK